MFTTLFTACSTLGRASPQLRAIFYILISTTAFSAMNVSVRALAGELHPTLIVMLRCLFTLLLLAPFVAYRGVSQLRTSRLPQHVARGVVGGIGMIGWTYSVSILPVTYATALSFTAPLFVTLLAMLFLGETVGRDRWLALIVGFIGTWIILRPDAHSFDSRALIVLLTSMFWVTTGILIKSLSATEPPLRMVFYMNVFMALLAAPFGLYHWAMPSLHVCGILLIIALCSLIMHVSMVRAYALAPLVTLMPFDFTRLISTALFAYLLFGETSDMATWFGAAIIIASAAFMARRDIRASAVE
jgi:drug/metabolite transporter (DMT)-like permease